MGNFPSHRSKVPSSGGYSRFSIDSGEKKPCREEKVLSSVFVSRHDGHGGVFVEGPARARNLGASCQGCLRGPGIWALSAAFFANGGKLALLGKVVVPLRRDWEFAFAGKKTGNRRLSRRPIGLPEASGGNPRWGTPTEGEKACPSDPQPRGDPPPGGRGGENNRGPRCSATKKNWPCGGRAPRREKNRLAGAAGDIREGGQGLLFWGV